eukprot:TRINITY_DN67881_c1_g3_i4.p1 TRINITY_DN67881_c1_g3~~TRINITY_DN67881_c1_g3_i4.p1  ORF type:complete len:842 (+),score=58.79 TRINITY_DN67881_c1_g3_i4:95-2620(+)
MVVGPRVPTLLVANVKSVQDKKFIPLTGRKGKPKARNGNTTPPPAFVDADALTPKRKPEPPKVQYLTPDELMEFRDAFDKPAVESLDELRSLMQQLGVYVDYMTEGQLVSIMREYDNTLYFEDFVTIMDKLKKKWFVDTTKMSEFEEISQAFEAFGGGADRGGGVSPSLLLNVAENFELSKDLQKYLRTHDDVDFEEFKGLCERTSQYRPSSAAFKSLHQRVREQLKAEGTSDTTATMLSDKLARLSAKFAMSSNVTGPSSPGAAVEPNAGSPTHPATALDSGVNVPPLTRFRNAGRKVMYALSVHCKLKAARENLAEITPPTLLPLNEVVQYLRTKKDKSTEVINTLFDTTAAERKGRSEHNLMSRALGIASGNKIQTTTQKPASKFSRLHKTLAHMAEKKEAQVIYDSSSSSEEEEEEPQQPVVPTALTTPITRRKKPSRLTRTLKNTKTHWMYRPPGPSVTWAEHQAEMERQRKLKEQHMSRPVAMMVNRWKKKALSTSIKHVDQAIIDAYFTKKERKDESSEDEDDDESVVEQPKLVTPARVTRPPTRTTTAPGVSEPAAVQAADNIQQPASLLSRKPPPPLPPPPVAELPPRPPSAGMNPMNPLLMDYGEFDLESPTRRPNHINEDLFVDLEESFLSTATRNSLTTLSAVSGVTSKPSSAAGTRAGSAKSSLHHKRTTSPKSGNSNTSNLNSNSKYHLSHLRPGATTYNPKRATHNHVSHMLGSCTSGSATQSKFLPASLTTDSIVNSFKAREKQQAARQRSAGHRTPSKKGRKYTPTTPLQRWIQQDDIGLAVYDDHAMNKLFRQPINLPKGREQPRRQPANQLTRHSTIIAMHA